MNINEDLTLCHYKEPLRKIDELIEYLRIFSQENSRIPTATDFNRGLLPTYKCYTDRWGSIEAARQASGIYDFIDRGQSPF